MLLTTRPTCLLVLFSYLGEVPSPLICICTFYHVGELKKILNFKFLNVRK